VSFAFGETSATFGKLSEQSSVSLLTVYPRDKAVYAIFGHTAIRVQDPERQIDWVYNYGFFDSSKPHFIYHFVKGETDYILGVENYRDFLFSYAADHSAVDEQVLNLSLEEKESVFNFLNTNALPENREYRYNYFFDNCTTRPRNIIEQHIKGQVAYPDLEAKTTFRDWVHICTAPYPWLSFGIDLVLGCGADSTIHARNVMFLPVGLMLAFDHAEVIRDRVSSPLVKEKLAVLDSEDRNVDAYRQGRASKQSIRSFFRSPLPITWGIFLLVAGFTIAGYYRKRNSRAVDFLLFSVAGIAGCIVCYICFVSTHPCTSYNLNAIGLHPLHGIAALLMLFGNCRKLVGRYHRINFIVLSIFILIQYFLPQEIPAAAIPLILCLWMRSGMRGMSSKYGIEKIKNIET
jgi:hypothetical protein